jgi:hypothetical protein
VPLIPEMDFIKVMFKDNDCSILDDSFCCSNFKLLMDDGLTQLY